MKISARWIASLVASGFIGICTAYGEGAETTAKPPAEAQKAPAKTAPLDINSASVDELKAIRGIGDANAKKIIEGRPYKRKAELVSKKILSQEAFDKIKKQIIARPATKS